MVMGSLTPSAGAAVLDSSSDMVERVLFLTGCKEGKVMVNNRRERGVGVKEGAPRPAVHLRFPARFCSRAPSRCARLFLSKMIGGKTLAWR